MLIAKLVHSQGSLRIFSNGSKIKLLNRISDTNTLLIGGISSCHSLCHPKVRKVLIRGGIKCPTFTLTQRWCPPYTASPSINSPLWERSSWFEVQNDQDRAWVRNLPSSSSPLSRCRVEDGGRWIIPGFFSPLKVKAKSVECGGEIKDPFGAAVTLAERRWPAINKLVWKLIRVRGGRGGGGGGRQDGASSGEMGESLASLMGCPSRGPGWRGLTCRAQEKG